jgi:hypothetical protein
MNNDNKNTQNINYLNLRYIKSPISNPIASFEDKALEKTENNCIETPLTST